MKILSGIKKIVVALFLTVFVNVSAHPFLSDVAPVAKDIDGVAVVWVQADVAQKATKTLNLSAREVLFLKIHARKSVSQRNLFGSKNCFTDELLALLRAKKASVLLVKAPNADDSFVLQLTFDEKGTSSHAIYAKNEKIQAWVLPAFAACCKHSRLPVAGVPLWMKAAGAGVGLAGIAAAVGVPKLRNNLSSQRRAELNKAPLPLVGDCSSAPHGAPVPTAPVQGGGVFAPVMPPVMPVIDVFRKDSSLRGGFSSAQGPSDANSPFRASRPPTPPSTLALLAHGPSRGQLSRAGAGSSARESVAPRIVTELDQFFPLGSNPPDFLRLSPRPHVDVPSSYQDGGRMHGFARLVLIKLANLMHLRESQVCFVSTLKDGKLDSRWNINPGVDLVVVEAHSRDAFEGLRNGTTIFSAQSRASLKVVVIPFSAFDNPAYELYSWELARNNWVVAVVDDGSKKYSLEESPEAFINLFKGSCPYALLISPEDGGNLKVWWNEGTNILWSMREINDNPLLFKAYVLCDVLNQRRRKLALSPKHFAADFSSHISDVDRQDVGLILESNDDVARLPAVAEELPPASGIAQQVQSCFDADLFNPLGSYEIVTASCMQMETWQEAAGFIDELIRIEQSPYTRLEQEASEARDCVFTPGIMTHSRRGIKPEVVHDSFAVAPHVDAEGLRVAGFAESEAEYDSPSRVFCSREFLCDQHRILLMPWTLVSGNKSAFLALSQHLKAGQWRIVFINDTERELTQDDVLGERFFFSYNFCVFITSPIGNRVSVRVLEPKTSSTYTAWCLTHPVEKTWIDVVRLWVHNPESILEDPSVDSSMTLKNDDGSLAFVPYEASGRVRRVDEGLISHKASALTFDRLEYCLIQETENPFAAPGVRSDIARVDTFVTPFTRHLQRNGGVKCYSDSDSAHEWSSSSRNVEKNTIFEVKNKDEIDGFIRLMAQEHNISCPAGHARYFVVPASLIENLWLDRVTTAVSSSGKVLLDGILNIGNWRLIVVDDTNLSRNEFIGKGLNPLIEHFLCDVWHYSVVAHNGSSYYGLHVNKTSSPPIQEEKVDSSMSDVINAIVRLQQQQQPTPWEEVKRVLAS